MDAYNRAVGKTSAKQQTSSGEKTNSEPVNKGGSATYTKADIGKDLGNGYYVGTDLKPKKRNPNSIRQKNINTMKSLMADYYRKSEEYN